MNTKKQSTLLNAWSKTKPKKRQVTKQDVMDITQSPEEELMDDDDDLLEAVEALEKTNFELCSSSNNANIEHIPGFDNNAGSIWIYPKNYPVRNYQFSMVKAALYKNTLICLPTGLGKTLIAAVVMYNFYRWYPQGKIIFMAPTKPLVSQQIESCYKVMGIPKEDTAQITGMTMAADKRSSLWHSKRVFFITPQVINNDLARGVVPTQSIKCVIVDEAHKAQGKYAYCQVIEQIASQTRNFRVVALSATPGTDIRSVQQVITNLLISHIEMRTEDSIDIQPYSHQRKVEKVVVKLDATILNIKTRFMELLSTFLRMLERHNVTMDHDPSRYTKYGLLMARDQYRKNPPSGLSKYDMGAIEGDFAILISLYHSMELLLLHGMRSFFIHLKSMVEGDKGTQRAKSVLAANSIFRGIYGELVDMFGANPKSRVQLTQGTQHNKSLNGLEYVYSHPKIKKMEEIVVAHFEDFNKDLAKLEAGVSTRVMVFSQYRDSVQEITELLQKHRPLLRPMQFLGHSTANGKNAKFTQKDQLKVVQKFRGAGYNVLVSTCVGEEGLDIGDVDLIVCFDSHKSPIRLVQRMGRTGRKRKGRIVMLVTEGKEEKDYNSSVYSRKSITKAITQSKGKGINFYPHSARMVPLGLNPQAQQMYMSVKTVNVEEPSTSRKKKTPGRKTMDIGDMLKKANNTKSKFLSGSQLSTWQVQVKHDGQKRNIDEIFDKPHMLSVQGANKKLNSNNSLSLNKWPSWQTHPQKCHLVFHSKTTQIFLEAMEMCDFKKQYTEAKTDKVECNKVKENDSSLRTDSTSKAPRSSTMKNSTTSFKDKLKNFKCADDLTQPGSNENSSFQQKRTCNSSEIKQPEICLESVPESSIASEKSPVIKTKKINSSSLLDNSLDFIDNLSALETPKISIQKDDGVIKSPLIAAPPKFSSFSLDNLNDFKDPLESTCGKKQNTRRHCFGIVMSPNETSKCQSEKNTEINKPAIKVFEQNCEVQGKDEETIAFPDINWEDDINFSLGGSPTHSPAKEEETNTSNLNLKSTDKCVNSAFGKIDHGDIDLSGVNFASTNPNESFEIKDVKFENKHVTKLNPADASANNSDLDLFGPDIEINFDLGNDFVEHIPPKKENIEKTAKTTLTQISENRVFFQDLKKKTSESIKRVSAVFPVNAKPVPKPQINTPKNTTEQSQKRHLKRHLSSEDDDFVDSKTTLKPKRQKSSFLSPLPYKDGDHLHADSPELLSQIPVRRNNNKKMCLNSDSDYSPSPKKVVTKVAPVRKMQCNQFIDDEAEVKDDVSSDEILNSSIEKEMMDFVNDASQLTQAQPVDERAIYLRSVRSPSANGNNAKFRLAQNINSSMNVFSQEVSGNETDYLHDSFVDDGEVFVEDHTHEVTLLSDVDMTTKQRVTRRQAFLNKNHDDKNLKNEPNKRKRIIMMEQSTDAENSTNVTPHIQKTKLTTPSLVEGNKNSLNCDEWKCKACTLINKQSSQTCELCDSEKDETNNPASSKWSCTRCTFENAITSTKCFMCNVEQLEHKSNKTEMKPRVQQTDVVPTFSHTPVRSFQSASNVIKTPENVKMKDNRDEPVSPVVMSSTPLAKRKLLLKTESERERRLRVCKEKQQELRRKLVEKKFGGATNSTGNARTMISPTTTSTINTSNKIKSTTTNKNEPPSIIVACKELSSAHQVITTLRLIGSTNVVVASIANCDYVLGVGTVAERMLVSELGNTINRKKISTRFQQLTLNYNKVYLILEQDRLKKGDLGGSSNNTCAKQAYINSSLCLIINAGIKVLHSNNPEDTAKILHKLAIHEVAINRGIPKSVADCANNPHYKAHIKLYMSMPRVTLLTALFLCQNFTSYKDVACSSIEKLMQRTHMNPCIAAEVYNFFRRKYQE